MAEIEPEDDLVLTPEIEARIRRQIAEGISYAIRWKLPREDPRHMETAAINWRPGDPNALAEAILDHVLNVPVPLNLDGQHYMIVRQEWPEDWNHGA